MACTGGVPGKALTGMSECRSRRVAYTGHPFHTCRPARLATTSTGACRGGGGLDEQIGNKLTHAGIGGWCWAG